MHIIFEVFVDTNVFVTIRDNTDSTHKKALKISEYLSKNKIRWATSSDVIGETLTVISKKLGKGIALDWYNAADPRPDYYRYLPSFFSDSLLAQNVHSQIQLNPSQLQINWDHLYWINQNSTSDKRARYLLEDRVEQSKKIVLNTRYRIQLNNRFLISFQGQYRKEVYTYFKRINDLLGSKYSINWNQFAEDNLPNSTAIQNDLNHPNQIIGVGDPFGYNYNMHLSQWLIMSQAIYTMPKFDFNAAIEYTSTYYQREGKYRNGVFPQNSFGLSEPNYFGNGQIKMGITYKLNGMKYDLPQLKQKEI